MRRVCRWLGLSLMRSFMRVLVWLSGMDCSGAIICFLPGSFLDCSRWSKTKIGLCKEICRGLGFVQRFVVRTRVCSEVNVCRGVEYQGPRNTNIYRNHPLEWATDMTFVLTGISIAGETNCDWEHIRKPFITEKYKSLTHITPTQRIQEYVKFDKDYHKKASFAIADQNGEDNEQNQPASFHHKAYECLTKKSVKLIFTSINCVNEQNVSFFSTIWTSV